MIHWRRHRVPVIIQEPRESENRPQLVTQVLVEQLYLLTCLSGAEDSICIESFLFPLPRPQVPMPPPITTGYRINQEMEFLSLYLGRV